jgi:hypothetical protein
MEPFARVLPNGRLLALPKNIRLGWQRQHSSLLRFSNNCGCKKFYGISTDTDLVSDRGNREKGYLGQILTLNGYTSIIIISDIFHNNSLILQFYNGARSLTRWRHQSQV